MLHEMADPYYNAVEQALTNLLFKFRIQNINMLTSNTFSMREKTVNDKPRMENPTCLCWIGSEPATLRCHRFKIQRRCPLGHSKRLDLTFAELKLLRK